MVRLVFKTKPTMMFNMKNFDQEIDFLAAVQRSQRLREFKKFRIRLQEPHWPQERQYQIYSCEITEMYHFPRKVDTFTGAKFEKVAETETV